MGKSRVDNAVNSGKYASTEAGAATAPPEKLGGVFFWMVAGLCAAKDLIDLPFALIELGLSATVIGIPMTILMAIASAILAVTIWIIQHAYFMTHGGLHLSAKIKRLVLMLVAIPLEIGPFLQILPMMTVMFVVIAWLENTIRKDNLLAHAIQLGIEESEKRHRARPRRKFTKEFASDLGKAVERYGEMG